MHIELHDICEYYEDILNPISEFANEIIDLEKSMELDESNQKTISVAHKSLRMLVDNFYTTVWYHPYWDYFIDEFWDNFKTNYVNFSPLIMFELGKKYIEWKHCGFDEIVPMFCESLEYSINSKFPIDSPVDVAFTYASVLYMSGSINSSEVEKSYRTAIDMISVNEGLYSKDNIRGLDIFILFAFILRQVHNGSLDLLYEFQVQQYDLGDVNALRSGVRRFWNYFGFSVELPDFEVVMESCLYLVEIYDPEESLPDFYGEQFCERDELSFLECCQKFS